MSLDPISAGLELALIKERGAELVSQVEPYASIDRYCDEQSGIINNRRKASMMTSYILTGYIPTADGNMPKEAFLKMVEQGRMKDEQ